VPPPGDCSDRVPCLAPDEVCDPRAFVCYPATGVCADTSECPRFDDAFPETASVACSGGFCRVTPPAAIAIPSLVAPAIGVAFPEPGHAFAATADVVFEWNASGFSSILLVLDGERPDLLVTPQAAAIWGLARPNGFVQQARPASEGFGIEAGTVTARAELPPDTLLYLLVQLVSDGALEGASRLVPFRVGASWPLPGDACLQDGLPGACGNPALPQVCLGGTCRALCASHVDCAAYSVPCGAPRRLAPEAARAAVWYRACE
jgi:hypothetical protein